MYVRTVFVTACLMISALRAQPASPAPTNIGALRETVENGLIPRVAVEGEPTPHWNVYDRMRRYRVPAMSVAVIHAGVIEWTAVYEIKADGSQGTLPDSTLFQAASISKGFTGALAIRLSQAGKLDLDAPIDTYLKPLQLPKGAQTSDHPVTLRNLLQHAAGATVSGFDGYSTGTPVPTAEQVILGATPANSKPVLVATRPDSRYEYSGGGYTVAQVAIEKRMQASFASLMEEWVLKPLNMSRSTFQQPLPKHYQSFFAPGYYYDRTPVEGGAHIYPELAAAGLWTTATDLAKFAIAIHKARTSGGQFMGVAAANEYLTPKFNHYALGLAVLGEGSDFHFTHQGGNTGYKCRYVMYTPRGDGVVAMTNSDNGMPLANEYIRAVFSAYKWPDFLTPRKETPFAVDPKTLETYVGRYHWDRSEDRFPDWVELVRTDTGFALVTPNLGKVRLLPTGQRQFVAPESGARIELAQADGAVKRIIVDGRSATLVLN